MDTVQDFEDLLDPDDAEEILQIGVAPTRIDLLRSPDGPSFEEAWQRRVVSPSGDTEVFWIDLDSLIEIKSRIDDARHQDDARILRQVRDRRRRSNE